VARRHRYRWESFIDNAKHRTHKDAIDWASELEKAGVGEIMITSIDNDGRKNGFDVNLIDAISKRVDIPVIASGGAGSSDDIIKLCRITNCDAVALSTLIHYDIENISHIKNNMNNNNIRVRL